MRLSRCTPNRRNGFRNTARESLRSGRPFSVAGESRPLRCPCNWQPSRRGRCFCRWWLAGCSAAESDSARILGAVRQADLVVSSGGGFINDVFWVHAAGVLGVLAAAQRLGKPTAMFGQGIGPLTHPVLTRLVARTMPRLL